MFIDYSGLDRYKQINDSFTEKCIILYRYYNEKTFQSKLEVIIQEFESLDYHLPESVFFMNETQLEQFVYLTLCNEQMKSNISTIVRCPTLYLLEPECLSPIKYKEYYKFQVELCKQIKDLRKEYRCLRIEIFENIKQLIMSLVPNNMTGIPDTGNINNLQKILLRFHSENNDYSPEIKIRNSNRSLSDDVHEQIIRKFTFYNFMFTKQYSSTGTCRIAKNGIKLLKTKHKIYILFSESKKRIVVFNPSTLELPNSSGTDNKENDTSVLLSKLFSTFPVLTLEETSTSHRNRHFSVNNSMGLTNHPSNNEKCNSRVNTINSIFDPGDMSQLFENDIKEQEKDTDKKIHKNHGNLEKRSSIFYSTDCSLPNSTLKPAYNLVLSKNSSYNKSETSPVHRKKNHSSTLTPIKYNVLQNQQQQQSSKSINDYKLKRLDDISLKEFIKYKLTRLKMGPNQIKNTMIYEETI